MATLFSIPIKEPFDPSSLKVEVKNTTIDQLYVMLKNDLIDLQPDFQRHGDLWNNQKKSRLIESIILGLPLPSFYFYVDEKRKKWVVIDGLQRLCALNDFMVKKTLYLEGLQFLGKTHTKRGYDDFSYFEQLDISMRSVTLNVISGDSSSEAKYIIFQRINSGGTSLRPAEIRNALYHGESMEFIKNLAVCNEFKKATNNSVSEKRMLVLDYVSRFFSFYIQGYEAYDNDNMDGFIGKSLEIMNNNPNCFKDLQNIFLRALAICHELLGKEAFRQPLTEKEKKGNITKLNPISIALFESTMYAIAKLTEQEQATLISRKVRFQKNYAALFQDPQITKLLSNGTNKFKSVYTRFTELEEVVKRTISNN